MESSGIPLPQRQRKRRSRGTHSSLDGSSADTPEKQAVQDIEGAEEGAVETKSVSRERIDACEYFGIPALAIDSVEKSESPKLFHDFSPSVTSFQFECKS